MSSTSQALGPNEPPAPPNWVMVQPYRRRSGPMGRPGSVCPAHELSGRPPLHHAAGSRHPVRPPWSSCTGRSTGATASGWRCAGSPSSPRWPTTGGATRAPGAAGSWTSGATSRTCSPLRATVRRTGGGPLVAIGHSLGGNVVIGAALASPRAFDAIGAYEPPMPWLGFRRQGGTPWPPCPTIPARRPSASSAGWWARAPGPGSPRRAGPNAAPTAPRWWPTCAACGARAPPSTSPRSRCPRVFGRGGPPSAPHHRRTRRVAGRQRSRRRRLRDRQRAARCHLSHPDHFAAMARLVVERARRPRPR